MLYIHWDRCIDCRACEPACPVSAIFREADLAPEQAALTEINGLWQQDKDSALAGIAPEP